MVELKLNVVELAAVLEQPYLQISHLSKGTCWLLLWVVEGWIV